jgi:hypothetical protein
MCRARSDAGGARGILLLLFVAVCADACGTPRVELRSPGKGFAIVFEGPQSRPWLPLVQHRVRAVVREGGRDVGSVDLYEADFFDTAFSTHYPERVWFRENALVLRTGPSRDQNWCDEVLIGNRGRERVSFLTVDAGSLLFVMSLKPGETLNVPVHPYLGNEIIEVTVSAGFGVGSEPLQARRRFTRPRGRVRYTVGVHDNEIALGFDSLPSMGTAAACR